MPHPTEEPAINRRIAVLSVAVMTTGTLLAGATAHADAATAHARIVTGGWSIPDPNATPGVVLTTSRAKICTRGYAASVRNVSQSTKNRVYAEYGITHHVPYSYEIDHDISLELGGSNSMRNLWPEKNDKARSNSKDRLENKLHSLICNGSISVRTAQAAIRGDWTKAYRHYIGPLGKFHAYYSSSPTPAPRPAPEPAPAPSGTDPNYGTCTNMHNYPNHAPYYRGRDPEYNYYTDRDNDGIVCE